MCSIRIAHKGLSHAKNGRTKYTRGAHPWCTECFPLQTGNYGCSVGYVRKAYGNSRFAVILGPVNIGA